MPVKRRPDIWIIALTGTLLLIGIVMIYSSSAVMAAEKYGDPYFFLKRQIVWAFIGIAGMFTMTTIDYRILKRYAYIIYAVIIAVLIAAVLPGIGHEVNGAQRWIKIGFFTFQPAEFAKIGLIVFFAAILSKKEAEGKITDPMFGYLPCLLALAIVVLLIQSQPDLGSAVIIAIVSFFMFMIAGVRKTHLMATALFAMPFLIVAVYSVDYRRRRIVSFLNPWDDASDSGYQIIQSFVALAGGGVFGTGLGASQQKLFFLPEPHTDFIFSIIGEELGFVGALIVIILFSALTWRGFRVGLKAPDNFGALLAFGVSFAIGFQALINIAVVLGAAPTKGLPLPFISLGGSALTMWLISIGLLLNVSEHTK